jgi:hypothetical protein
MGAKQGAFGGVECINMRINQTRSIYRWRSRRAKYWLPGAVVHALQSRLRLPRREDRLDKIQRLTRAIVITLFKIPIDAAQLVCHMDNTDDRTEACGRERVEGRGLHLDSEDPVASSHCDCLCGFTKRRVGRPGRTDTNRESGASKGVRGDSEYLGIGFYVGRWREIVIACAFIPKGPFNKDVIRGRSDVDDLTSRANANEQIASGGEKLFSYQD